MSFSLPFFSLAVPFVWSERPSDFLVLSPVTAPAASLARPLTLSIAPSPLSWPLLFLPTCVSLQSLCTPGRIGPYSRWTRREPEAIHSGPFRVYTASGVNRGIG